MKTLTVTFHHTTNYGALLQMYSLHSTIKSMGHENLVLESRVMGGVKLKKSIKKRAISLYMKMCAIYRKKQVTSLNQSFFDFKQKNVDFTRLYTSMDELRKDPPQVDCLITGSDQVWNMTTHPSMIPSRFLDFGKHEWKRFSYAASIEVMKYTEEQKEYVKKCLKRFDGISVRELSAKTYLESFCDLEIEHVVDPVFLKTKEEWAKCAKPARIKGGYILCYQVLSNKQMQRVACGLRKKTGLPIVSICNLPFPWIRSDKSLYDVCPEEFLGLFLNASYVVTTSFHGTAFGVLCNKPTYSLVRPGASNRAEGLMKFLGLDDYVVYDNDELKNTKIDWNHVNSILESERKKSLDYLKRMLQ